MINIIVCFIGIKMKYFTDNTYWSCKVKKMVQKIKDEDYTSDKVIKRREEWKQFSVRTMAVLNDFKREFGNKNIKIYIDNSMDKKTEPGIKYDNFHYIGVIPRKFYSGIRCTETDINGNIIRKSNIITHTGYFHFGQSTTGHVCVNFVSYCTKIEECDTPKKYIYGIYEPNKLTYSKIRKIVYNAFNFMFNSHVDGKLNLKNRWIVYRANNESLIEGLLLGIIASAIVQICWSVVV